MNLNKQKSIIVKIKKRKNRQVAEEERESGIIVAERAKYLGTEIN